MAGEEWKAGGVVSTTDLRSRDDVRGNRFLTSYATLWSKFLNGLIRVHVVLS